MSRYELVRLSACIVCTILLPANVWSANQEKRADNRMRGRPLVFNQDCADALYPPELGKVQETLRDWLQRAFAAGAGVFVADVANPDIVFVKDLPTAEIFGSRFPEQHANKLPRYRQIQELFAQGTDILHMAVDEGHKVGALVLGGMRMSDAHHGVQWDEAIENQDAISFTGGLLSQFIKDHPEWCNTWEGGRFAAIRRLKPGTLDATLNYSIPEVQAHRLQILREMVTNYEIDGLELNWMRFGRHFPASKQREYLGYLTDFVREVRVMLDEVAAERGCERLILGHRVASSVDECLNIGCDIETWAREGYADYLAPMEFNETDMSLRVEEFVVATEGTNCLVYPGPQIWIDVANEKSQYIYMDSLAKFRAVAHNYLTWGADGLSTFNIYNWPPERQEFYTEALAILSDHKRALSGPRNYLYAALGAYYTDGPRFQQLTFGANAVGKRQIYYFRMADGRNGEALTGILRFRIYNATPQDKFAVELNGQEIPAGKFDIEYQPEGEKVDERFTWRPGLRFEIPLADCPPFRGDNELRVMLLEKHKAAEPMPVMEVMEVHVDG